jgi:hypothetical protein
MSEIISAESGENLPSTNQNIDLDTFKSIYYWQNVKPDTQIKFFRQQKNVTNADVVELNERLNNKIKTHKVETYIASINFILEDGNMREYGAWPEYEREKWEYINQKVTAINITWDLTFTIDKFQLPQKHTLKVRLGNSIAPKDMFQMMFTSDEPSEIMQSRAWGMVKVDFINQNISNELINIVNNWYEGLKKCEEQNSFIKFLEKRQKYFLNFIANFTPIFFLFLGYIYHSLLCEKFGFSKELNILTFQRATVYLSLLYIIGLLIGKVIAKWLNKKINSFDYHSGFHITKGDKNSFEELNSSNKKIKKEIIGKMIIAIASGIVAVVTKVILENILNNGSI